jgi:16S rRNA (uracil1498-N3)-methyltransferase
MIEDLGIARIFITPEQADRLPQTFQDPYPLTLTDSQHHYLTRVLRLRSSQPARSTPNLQFIIQTPQGQRWLSQLDQNSHIALLFRLLPELPVLPIQVRLLAALPKNGFDEVVRQATELGVSEIIPLLSERTLLKPSAQRVDRWQRIAQEAAEQCERRQVPHLSAPLVFRDALQQVPTMAQRYFCVTRQVVPSLITCLFQQKATLGSGCSIAIVTGPEGGWTEAEVEEAVAIGYQLVSLGPLILRSVTAPLAALAMIMGAAEDFGV